MKKKDSNDSKAIKKTERVGQPKESTIKINAFLAFYVLYILFVVINDILCFIFKRNFSWLFFIMSGAITACAGFLAYKKSVLKKPEFSRLDIILFAILGMIVVARISIPESSFDTLNYHLFSQERVFGDKTSFDFFPARWINTFSLPLADRMHFLVRKVFGYRLGVAINIYSVVVTYYLIKDILQMTIKSKGKRAIFSSLIVFTEQIMSNMMTYYVDILPIPIFLGIILLILDKKDGGELKNIITLFMAGVLVSMKLTNAFLLIILAALYVFKNRKTIGWKTFVIGIPIAILPLCVYILDNYIQVGNPVFPFYNSIFKSEWLPQENWIETQYGPKSIKELLLWPIYALVRPRRAFDVAIYYGRISFGYIAAFVMVIKAGYLLILKKEKKELFVFFMSAVYIVLCLVWGKFMMGYIRYALILDVLAGIVMAIMLHEGLKSENKIGIVGAIICVCFFAHTAVLGLSDMIYGSTELSWRPSFYMDKGKTIRNLKHLLDRSGRYDDYLNDIDCLGTSDFGSGYAALLSEDRRIIGLNMSYDSEYGKERYSEMLKSCKNLYVVTTTSRQSGAFDYLEKLGIKTAEDRRAFKVDFVDIDNDLVLQEIDLSSAVPQ